MTFLPIDTSDWTVIGVEQKNCHHIWKREGTGSYDVWVGVTDDFSYWEFRQCVLCNTKQIRDPQS